MCADGGFSTARQRLLGVAPRYAGYVTWRGLVPQSRLASETWSVIDGAFTYGLLSDSHIIVYPIPELADDRIEVRGKQLNFQWYWNIPEGPELDEIMTDREGVRRPVSVHHALLQRRYFEAFRERARRRLAAPFGELLTAAEAPFVTVIADAEPPRMAVGRVCLIGDAGVTVRPHAAAGAAKAADDAWMLADALTKASGVVGEALRCWEPRQLELGYALLGKVRRMGSVLQSGGTWLPGDPENRFGLPRLSK